MHIPNINFHNIRPHDGSQNEGFEELVCQLLSLHAPSPNAEWIRKRGAGGDAAVEAYWKLSDGSEHCLQSKYFFSLGASQRTQLNKSVKTALLKHPSLTKYIVAIPFNLGEQREGKKWSERQHWNAMVSQWKKISSHEIEFVLWDASRVTGFLNHSSPKIAGRLKYWFDETCLTNDWFRARSEEAISNLGPRYTPEMHVDIELQGDIEACIHSEEFWDKFVSHARFKTVSSTNSKVIELQNETRSTSTEVRKLLLDAKAARVMEPYSQLASKKVEEAKEAFREFYDNNELSDRDLQDTYALEEQLDSLMEHLHGTQSRLAKSNAITIYGPAGTGKSHLLADVVSRSVKAGMPAVLALGQQLNAGTPAAFLKSVFDWTGEFENFLGALDAAGQANSCRAVLAIDALNEGNGKIIWPDAIAGLIETTSRFPHIVLILSCRDTYFKSIFRNTERNRYAARRHNGFAGHELEASRIYMDGYGLVRPEIPFLDPEFSNPLFLKTLCLALQKTGKTHVPKGLRGLTATFEFYFASVCAKIEERLLLNPDRKLAWKTIQALLADLLKGNHDALNIDRAYETAEAIYDKADIVAELRSEGVLTRDMRYTHRSDNVGEEVYRFSYERYFDFLRAQQFIDEHFNPTFPEAAFKLGGPFRTLLADRAWLHTGFIEALTILVPERFYVELFYLIEWDEDADRWDLSRIVRDASAKSIAWRDPRAITDDAKKLLNEELGGFPDASNILIRCATEPQHKFNALFLHRHLMKLPMAERDASWSIWLFSKWYPSSGGENFPVSGLIDWGRAVQADKLDEDRRYLACIALAWFCTTSQRSIRDHATKAIVNILGDNVSLARKLLLTFVRVNDPYVLERVLLAAYACAIENRSKAIRKLVRTATRTVARYCKVVPNIQIQDSIVSMFLLAEELDCKPQELSNFRQIDFPRMLAWPMLIPRPDEVEALRDDLLSVHGSVMGGDFGIYTMRDIFDFSPTELSEPAPETWDVVLEKFKKKISQEVPGSAEILARFDATKSVYKVLDRIKDHHRFETLSLIRTGIHDGGPKGYGEEFPEHNQELYDEAKSQFEKTEEDLKSILNDEQLDEWRWLHDGDRKAEFSRRKAKRWIVKRVKDLGWTKDRFEEFERSDIGYRGRSTHEQERIGKKYQWIAYHEFLAVLAANVHYVNEYDHGDKFLGAWQIGRRDIDPTLLSDGGDGSNAKLIAWWTGKRPSLSPKMSATEASAWVQDYSDLSDDFGGTACINPETGRSTIVLHFSTRESEAEDDFATGYRMTSENLESVIVKNEDVQRTLEALRHTLPIGDLSNPQEYSGYAFLGEYPWHPSWFIGSDFNNDHYLQSSLPKDLSVHYPYRTYMCENSGYDASMQSSVYLKLPSSLIIRELELRYDRPSATFLDPNNTVAFSDPSYDTSHSSAAVFDAQLLSGWLKRHGYSVLSFMTSMKQQSRGRDYDFVGEMLDCQLWAFDGNDRNGERWTIFRTMGPTETVVRSAIRINDIPLTA